ncbi:MAG: SGNH/GDSL hydrolase family protein [Verrucomicrobiota bacterium]
MNKLFRFIAGMMLFGLIVFPAQAAFTSLYIFGDGVSTTTNNPLAGEEPYYGLRRSNGRVWVELLAQQLGLTNNYWYSTNSLDSVSYTNLSTSSTNWSYSSNNWSYYGDYSSNMVANVNAFTAPADASNALFIVWVNDADFVGDMYNIYPSTNIIIWTNAINQSLSNHFNVITNLYTKGARTLIMPNAVDITETPEYDNIASANKSFIRQMVINFNTAFTAMLTNTTTSLPGLKIYEPDVFTLLNNVVTNSAYYGLTNALYDGQSIDVIENVSLTDKSLDGPGTNYIFWDATDPTAKFHAQIADLVQQLLSPVQISQLTSLNGSNQLDMANVPIGRNGFVNGSTDLVNWTSVTNINSTNATETISLPPSGPLQFYQLSFPFAWSWP